MDEADHAQIMADRFLAESLKVVQGRRGGPACLSGQGRTLRSAPTPCFCQGCGDPIPKARREAVPDCTRCIGCQAAHERRLA